MLESEGDRLVNEVGAGDADWAAWAVHEGNEFGQ